MVYRLQTGVAKNQIQKLKQKITNLTMAAVLAFTSLGAPLFVLTQNATALSKTSYGTVPLTGWTTDRTAPSGGAGTESFDGRNVLYLDVDAPSNAPSGFYRYEGIKRSVGTNGDTVKADLYVDSSWPSNVRIGLWGVGYDTSGAISSYPILEYNPADSATGWRIWDSAGSGGWRNVTINNYSTGWNTLELALNISDNLKTDIYVNDVLIGQSTTDEPTNDLREIILNNRNFGTDDYRVRWSNIQVGTYLIDTPSNVHFTRGVTPVANGTTVNYTDVTLHWDTVDGPTRYRITATHPDGTTTNFQPSTSAGWNPASMQWNISDNVRQGLFGDAAGDKGQGSYSYTVAVKDPVTGLWSAESTPVTLSYDHQSPTAYFTATPPMYVTGNFHVKGAATDNVKLKSVFFDVRDPSASGNQWKAGCVNGTTVLNYTNSNKDATIECDINISNLTEGHAYTLRIHAGDYSGYGGGESSTLIVDKTKPTVSITTPAKSALVAGSFTVEGTATDTTSPIKHVDYTITRIDGIGGSYVANVTNGTATGTDDWTFDAAGLASGFYRLKVQAFDAAGNWRYLYHDIEVDSDAPVVDDTFVLTMYTGDKKVLAPTVSEEHGPVTYKWNTSPLLLTNPNEATDEATFSIGPAKKGTYSVTLVTTDILGNETLVEYKVTVETPSGNSSSNNSSNSNSSNSNTNRNVNPQQTQNPQILGASTYSSNPSDSSENTSDENSKTEGGEVKGVSTSTANLENSDDDTVKNSAFLGLGWWWLPLLVLLFGLFWSVLGRRSEK